MSHTVFPRDPLKPMLNSQIKAKLIPDSTQRKYPLILKLF